MEFTPRPPSTKPTRAEVYGTGREIDDFSSDDGSAKKKGKVIRLNKTDDDDEETKIRSRKLSSSSSSSGSLSSSSSSSKLQKGQKQKEATPVVSVEMLDREEKEQARIRQEQLRRQELRRQAEEKQTREQQEEREKVKKLKEERRQSQLFEQQMEEDRKRKNEEAERKRQEEEKERRRREEDEIRSARDSETDADRKERERLDAQKRRENQILEEQRRREERRLQEEREKEERWKESEKKREEQRKKKEEETFQRRRELEESLSSKRESSTTSDADERGLEYSHGQQQKKDEGGRLKQEEHDVSSSSREESSTALSGESSSSDSSTSASSSGSSTPIQTPRDDPRAATHLQIHEEPPRPASPLPSPSSSQDRAHLTAARDDSPSLPRAYSPVPPPAMYRDRRSDDPRAVTRVQIHDEPPRPASPLPPPSSSQNGVHLTAGVDDTHSMPRAYSPLPQPVTYRDRRSERQSVEPARESESERAVVSPGQTQVAYNQTKKRGSPSNSTESSSGSEESSSYESSSESESDSDTEEKEEEEPETPPKTSASDNGPRNHQSKKSDVGEVDNNRRSTEDDNESSEDSGNGNRYRKEVVPPAFDDVLRYQSKKADTDAENARESEPERAVVSSSSSESESDSDTEEEEEEEEEEHEIQPETPPKTSASDNGPRNDQSKKSDVGNNRHSTADDDEINEDRGNDNSYMKKVVPSASDDRFRSQSKKADTDAGKGNVAVRAAAVPRLSEQEEDEDEGSGTEDSSSDNESSTSVSSTSSPRRDAGSTAVYSHGVEGKRADDVTQSGAAHDEGQRKGESLPRSGETTPPAKTYDGRVTDLLSSPDSLEELSNILLNKAQVDEVASYLEKTDTVKQVCLNNNGLDDDDVQKLTAAICASSAEPVMLNLTANSLTQDSVKHILTVLMVKPSIKLLSLQSNPVGDKGVEELVKGLQILHQQARSSRKTQEANSLDTMSLNSEASSVAGLSTQKYLLQGLDLSDTSISDVGAHHVAQLVSSNVSIEALGLSHNPGITVSQGWRDVGVALSRNRCLRNLILDGNALGDVGLSHVAKGLQSNRALRSLTLQDCEIGTAGGKVLLELLKKNTTLLELVLSPGNDVPENLAGDIQKYLALNRTPYNSLTFY